MNSQPHHAKTSPPEQSDSFEILGESLSEFGVLISSEIGPDIEAKLIPVLLVDIDSLFLSILVLAKWGSFLHAALLF
jgi:hypothetical protein